MSYSETDGRVVLTMSRADYERLLKVFAIATVSCTTPEWPVNTTVVELLNRLNEGNPDYLPYQVQR